MENPRVMSLEILPENAEPTVPLQDSEKKKRKRNKERSGKCNVRFLGSDHGRIYVLLCRLCRTVTAVWVGASKDSAGAPTAHAPPARYIVLVFHYIMMKHWDLTRFFPPLLPGGVIFEGLSTWFLWAG